MKQQKHTLASLERNRANWIASCKTKKSRIGLEPTLAAIDRIANRIKRQKTRTLLNPQGCVSDCNEESLGEYFNI